MEFLKKEIILANGKNCVLQSPGPKDAQKMMDYLKQTAAETHFMLRLPEEVTMTVEAEEKYLKSALEDPLSLMINAVVDGKLAGNVGLSPIAPRQKTRHRVSVGIAVRKEYWGMGLGRLLMQEAIGSAPAMGYTQMELGVYSDIERAVRLYETLGFERWGVLRCAFRLPDGTYRDEIQMGLFLK